MAATVIPTTTRDDQHERDLQDLFVNWIREPPARARIAGRPRSISFAGDPKRESAHSAWGYRARADIVGDTPDGQRLVIELKLGKKYEPLGLAEVLFHAERLAGAEHRIRPVLVTQYNLWNRVVIQSLHRRMRETIVDYYEVGVVEVEGKPCFWFDAPLEPWQPIATVSEAITAFAKCIGDDARDAAWLKEVLHWYRVPETGTYIATAVRLDERPAVVEVPHLMLAPIEDGRSRWIAWAGIPPALDAVSARWSMDSYWICSV